MNLIINLLVILSISLNFNNNILCINLKNNNEHVISFIMPCYNCSKTVIESLNSIYKQNLQISYEVICTNDCSTDNTLEILNDYAKKHPNMKVFSNQKNMGGAYTRNQCVNFSKGDLIFCLDSDNILAENSVNNLIMLLDKSGCEAAAFKEIRFFTDNFTKYSSWTYETDNNISDINHFFSTNKTPPSSGNYLYTRESFLRAEKYPENAGALDTWGFGLRQYATGTKIAILPDSFYWHRISDDSYWKRDNIGERLSKQVVYDLISEFSQLFTPEFNQYLIYCRQNEIHFFEELMENNKIKLISPAALNFYFRSIKMNQKII